MRILILSLACLALPAPSPRPGAPAWQRPTGEVWPILSAWDQAAEEGYSAFVARLGQAVWERRCRQLTDCLRDPQANALHDGDDASLSVPVDCADLPYTLRAYYAFKRRLPFSYVAAVGGTGDDPRYLQRTAPREWRDHRELLTPAALLLSLRRTIHSGMYRMAPAEEGSDFYPVRIARGAVRPGTVFYDPNGHVLVVAQVQARGVVSFIDAHPDSSLTYRRFGAAFVAGPAGLGGGFKNFRPLRLKEDGRLLRAANRELADFDGSSQWDRDAWRDGARERSYQDWVRAQLREPGAIAQEQEGREELREQQRALCRAIGERVDAVALAAPLARRPHPGTLPPNIYGAALEWEVYATPARDARLKAAAKELADTIAAFSRATAEGASVARALWAEEAARPECRFHYLGSTGRAVPLSLGNVLSRLFRLSFDPYHCPELRWGAPPGSIELGLCPDGPQKHRLYDEEARLRNRIDRIYGVPTPLESGPDEPPALRFPE